MLAVGPAALLRYRHYRMSGRAPKLFRRLFVNAISIGSLNPNAVCVIVLLGTLYQHAGAEVRQTR